MTFAKIAFLLLIPSALIACSDADTSSAPDVVEVTTRPTLAPLDANNYKATLQSALSWLRSDYSEAFIQVAQQANQMFTRPVPNVHETFNVSQFQVGAETKACNSGQVTRDITSTNVARYNLQMVIDFNECQLGQRVYSGKLNVELQSDSPARLGGQNGSVSIVFENMTITDVVAPSNVRTLSGMFKNTSGWGAASIGYTREYVIDTYSELSGDAELYVANASYVQELQSDYYSSEDAINTVAIGADGQETVEQDNRGAAYYRLTESGSATVAGTVDERQVQYTISIDPQLEYASQPGVNDLPVYSDNLLAGKITFISTDQGRMSVTPDENDGALVQYAIEDGSEPVSEIDDWLFPIQCNDDSVFNARGLCAARL